MTELPGRHVLIAGVTARAMAQSAARAGYRVTAVDAFGDLDLRAVAEVITLRSTASARFRPSQAVRAAHGIPAGLVLYTSNFENYPESVKQLAVGRRLLGNPPSVLTRVRNPLAVAAFLRGRGFAAPLTRASSPPRETTVGGWLAKPRLSGGGHGVAAWRRGQPLPKGSYLQERIEGAPGSIIFAADGARSVVLGISRQLVGDTRFGARGYRYCGSLIGSQASPIFPRQQELLNTGRNMATALTEEFGLVGLNGIDFIASKGVPYPIEVNPRYSASMELLERVHRVSMFEIHLRACCGTLPRTLGTQTGVAGKAIVFARTDLVLGNTAAWVGQPAFADIPSPAEPVQRGRPICTVFGRGSDRVACLRSLIRRTGVVYRRASARAGQAA